MLSLWQACGSNKLRYDVHTRCTAAQRRNCKQGSTIRAPEYARTQRAMKRRHPVYDNNKYTPIRVTLIVRGHYGSPEGRPINTHHNRVHLLCVKRRHGIEWPSCNKYTAAAAAAASQRRRSVDKLPIDNQALCSELQTRECAVGIRRKNTKIKVVEAEMHWAKDYRGIHYSVSASCGRDFKQSRHAFARWTLLRGHCDRLRCEIWWREQIEANERYCYGRIISSVFIG